ncbi:hypothetical protein [Streptomyces camelliae]|uniref:Lipoprotein n=1 Tax=Streptomyces camelliae TaxID=3004093 RepID=A0ABY7NYH4_9ACTN|nr:hypothetical protein [Streptomyces sp. HUAS 2-6]WBO63232.1 hypothetical protein O1G22_10520 [Streptomyces sp. HUAS 2-6]
MRKVLPLALAGLFAVSACQFAGGDDDPAGEARRLNTRAAFPLHAYVRDSASPGAEDVDRAQWILAKTCMVRLGFTGFAVLDTKSVESTYPERPGTLDLTAFGDDSPYGVDDPDLASEHGYHGRKAADAPQSRQWPVDQFLALTGEFQPGDSRLTHGHRIPEGGCLGQAMRTIYDAPPKAAKVGIVNLRSYDSLAMQLWYQSHQEAQKDPAWKKADRAWADCMKKQGLHYSDPDKAAADFAWYRTEQPSAKEKKTAAADARCKLDTGYIPAAHALDTRTQKAAIDRNKQKLDDLRATQERALRNARTIIAKES